MWASVVVVYVSTEGTVATRSLAQRSGSDRIPGDVCQALRVDTSTCSNFEHSLFDFSESAGDAT
jgi:hypothetical protein